MTTEALVDIELPFDFGELEDGETIEEEYNSVVQYHKGISKFFTYWDDTVPELEDNEKLDIEDTTFDSVFAFIGSKHFTDQFALELFRIVKNNGNIIIIANDKDVFLDGHTFNLIQKSFIVSELLKDSAIIERDHAVKNHSIKFVIRKNFQTKNLDANIADLKKSFSFNIPRLIFHGDDPRLTTGFGGVGGSLSKYLSNSFLLSYFGKYSKSHSVLPGEVPFDLEMTCQHNPDGNGQQYFARWAGARNSDMIFFNADPGFIQETLMAMHMFVDREKTRIGAYFPVEGLPVAPPFIDTIQTLDAPITYCKFGAEELEKQTGKFIDYVYHGVDHAPFQKYDPEYRKALRNAVGYSEDNFVVMNVARNKRTNVQPDYIEAMAILSVKGYDKIKLYLHCALFENFLLNGWELTQIIKTIENKYSVSLSHSVLIPNIDQLDGVAYYSGKFDFDNIRISNSSDRATLFQQYSMIDRYNFADLYMDFSQVQGFGLPALEAAKCGLPIIAIDDKLARSELLSPCAVEMVPVEYRQWWTNDAQLVGVNAETIADRIEYWYNHRDELEPYSQKSIDHASKFKWEDSAKKIEGIIKKVI